MRLTQARKRAANNLNQGFYNRVTKLLSNLKSLKSHNSKALLEYASNSQVTKKQMQIPGHPFYTMDYLVN